MKRINPLSRYEVSADGCWLWTGPVNRDGYGSSHEQAKPYRYIPAHRQIYQLIVGPIEAGMELDHLCRNTRCVNPSHLEPVTHRDNMLRGLNPCADHARQTHAQCGHPFDRLDLDRGTPHRRCSLCYRAKRAANARRYRAQKRARELGALRPGNDRFHVEVCKGGEA